MPDEKSAEAGARHSDFIVYVDESGDHALESIDREFPVFVLAFCVFYQQNYIDRVVPAVERLKFDTFGHDIVVLHERDIRKELEPFKFRDRPAKDRFIGNLTEIIEGSNFILIASLIDKRNVGQPAAESMNCYHIALGACLEALFDLMAEKGQEDRETHIVFERRGKREDNELELEFRRFCDRSNRHDQHLPFRIVLANKQVNSTGLQLADLVARPIGIKYLRPNQPNRAFEVLRRKFFCKGGRSALGLDFEGWGLNLFPAPESERPR
ncbi:DUF3800 domain-containing protein [Novosphingobium sp. B 225]|uniref:DUF3800 domain-containing protein n=1 Tax=Novosphingobium sp. B 225 TaxID=1961849 RepID=UPI000B4ADB76|nr:DUF3800 domain-containing protein [Novosphingobium sp. B 225]